MEQDNYNKHLTSFFKNRGHLSRIELIAYVDEQLPGEQALQIEKHLIECPLCSEAINTLTEIGTEHFIRSFPEDPRRKELEEAEDGDDAGIIRPLYGDEGSEQTENSLDQDDARRKLPWWQRYRKQMGIAASIALIAVCGWYFLSPQVNMDNFESQFFAEDYLVEIIPTFAGKANFLERGNAAYKKRNWREAQELLLKVGQEHDFYEASRLLLADISLRLGEAEKGISLLENYLQNTPPHKEEAEWLLCRAYFAGRQFGKLETQLGIVSGAKGFYQQKARDALKYLLKLKNKDVLR